MTSISSNGTINTFYDNFIRIGSGISEISIMLRFREDLIENPVNRIMILPKPERSRHCNREQIRTPARAGSHWGIPGKMRRNDELEPGDLLD